METTQLPKTRRITKKTSTVVEATTPTGISVEPMTIVQFRSYLKGITFVGGPNWHPSRAQWEAIVQIVDQLIVGEPTAIPQQPTFRQPIYQQPMVPQQPAVHWQTNHSEPQMPPPVTFSDNFTQAAATSVTPMQTDPDDYNSPFI